ncbi:MAG: bifunctional folylpolyglutamate synthase/dihydrofolate synthase [Nonlabens sp.]|nr:bifunctional folylpolyglutamate synthase/dihydrofolate synthase [Nonlabens sp.]
MNYQQTLDWLFTQLPMYQRVGAVAYKANLDNTLKLDAHLKHPHHHFKTIHVAGTNGKGSTCHMLASILQEAGFKVGLYTSPHLKDFRERIKINGVMVPEEFVVDFVSENKSFFEKEALSFFEMTVGMAFSYFKQEQVDIAIIETGLGGRLDSTNIITPLVSVITTIDKDHMAFLGNTLGKIAMEKAGIMKENVPVVIGERRGWLRARFCESGTLKQAAVHLVDHRSKSLPTDLRGIYQKDNVRTALKTLEVLKADGHFDIDEAHIKNGLLNVIKNTGLRGRYETLQLKPKVVAETAHNPAGLKLLNAAIATEQFDKLHIILGMAADKDLDTIIQFLPKQATYYVAKPNVQRGMQVSILSDKLKKNGFDCTAFESVMEALNYSKSVASKDDLIIVTGSIFVVAEVI